MKKNLYKIILVILFLLTISYANIFNNNINVLSYEMTEPVKVAEPSLNIYKKNVSYSSEIYIMYAVSYEGIDVTLNSIKMLFFDGIQDEYTALNASYVVKTSGSATISGVKCIIFSSKGLAAKQMTDDIYARAYVEIDGKTVYSEVVKYSVLDYYYEIKEKGTASTSILNLVEAMIDYGAAAQINFNYNIERLANATYYKVAVENGNLNDGFSSGRYQNGDLITLIANTPLDGMKFLYWQDESENIVSTSETLELKVESANTYKAVYIESTVIKDVEQFVKEVQYNSTLMEEDLPDTVIVNNALDQEEELDVVWDLTTYNSTQIGKQVLFGSVINTDYVLESPIKLIINVSAFTFDYDEINEKYAISKYYGIDEELTIPSTFNNISVATIKENAFENASTIKTLVIPSTIETIEFAALSGCINIESLTVPFIGESLYSTKSFGYIFGATSSSESSSYVPQTLKELCIENSVSAFEIYKKYHPEFVGTEEEWLESIKSEKGVCVASAYIDEQMHLIFLLSNGREIDAGCVGMEIIETYTVSFVDYNGDIIKKITNVESGAAVNAPDDPIRKGFKFIGWDGDFNNITSDVTIKALYETDHNQLYFTYVDNGDGTMSAILSVEGDVNLYGLECKILFESVGATYSNVASNISGLAFNRVDNYIKISFTTMDGLDMTNAADLLTITFNISSNVYLEFDIKEVDIFDDEYNDEIYNVVGNMFEK